jgi:hypothetical protein
VSPEQHYVEAEECLAQAGELLANADRADYADTREAARDLWMEAQVHATLAACRPPDSTREGEA